MSNLQNRLGNNLNRKILDIESLERNSVGEIEQLVVNVIRDDDTITQEGTKLDADELNDAVTNIIVQKITNDLEYLKSSLETITIESNVSENFNLPSIDGGTIQWVSNSSYIQINDNMAILTRELVDNVVKLTAYAKYETAEMEKNFIVTVVKRELTDREKAEAIAQSFEFTVDLQNITENFTLPVCDDEKAIVEWYSNNEVITIEDNVAIVTRQLNNESGKLIASVSYGDNLEYAESEYEYTVLARSMTDSEKVSADANAISISTSVTSNFTLPTVGENGSEITWTSSDTSAINISGSTATVTRILSDVTVTLTAKVKLNSVYTTRTYDVTVEGFTSVEIVTADLEALEIDEEVSESFTVPLIGVNGSSIEWDSLNEDVISFNGAVANVTPQDEDVFLYIGAKATFADFYDSKYFGVTVKAKSLTDIERVTLDANEISVPSSVASNFTLPTVGENGSSISWESSDDFICISGSTAVVTQWAANTTVTLTATVCYNNQTTTRTYNVVVLGYCGFTPLEYSYNWTQEVGELKETTLTLISQTSDKLYAVVESDYFDIIDCEYISNNSTTVDILFSETQDLNQVSSVGSSVFTFNVKVYLYEDKTVLLGEVPVTISYYYASTSPDD